MLPAFARQPSRLRRLGLIAGIGLAALSGASAATAAPPVPPEVASLAPAGEMLEEEVIALDVLPAAAGGPAAAAWFSGRDLFVVGPDGTGSRHVGRVVGGFERIAVTMRLELSRDGRRLAVAAGGGIWLVDLVAGGPAVELPVPTGDRTAFQWSPDGSGLLVMTDALRRCGLEPAVGCRVLDRRALAEFGATWSPDGTRVAYIRARRDGRTSHKQLIARDASGPSSVRVLESDTWSVSLTPPTWTRRGLAWSSYRISGFDRGRRTRSPGLHMRIRTRVLREDGRVRTLNASETRLEAGDLRDLPFLAASDSPNGDLLGLHYAATRRTAAFSLRSLSAEGVLGEYGVRIGRLGTSGDAGDGSEAVDIVGVLDDGRVALIRKRDRSGKGTLYLATPGHGLGAPIASGVALTAAVAFPNAVRNF